ncbi:lipase family protein [Antrihabitans stalactiti]|uniref:lipase family protein n=1 Tax=Antrihabitans stalactiti TaxID=2584121 RepID=UPI00197D16B0
MIRRLAIVALIALSCAVPAQAEPLARPGAVVDVVPLQRDRWLPGAADASLVKYWTTGPLGTPALSTGAIWIPPGTPPPGGWPVLSWGHEATGLGDDCAPTVNGDINFDYLQRWLAQGYAIVATDYVGLGTPGIHPYLDGRSEAHSVIDMVRAARAVEPSLSSRWAAFGQSQGGQAALVTASMATTYAPDLDFRGAVATGPPSNLENLAFLGGPGFPDVPVKGFNVYVTYILASMRAVHPELDIDSYLTPFGRTVLDEVETICIFEAADRLEGIGIGSLLSRQLDDPKLLAALRDWLAIPTRGYARPFFIGQGLLDPTVPAPLTFTLASELATNGQPMTFRTYPTGHNATTIASLPDATDFMRQLFAR